MLTLRLTPATSTRASRFGSSTTSRIWPGMARHTAFVASFAPWACSDRAKLSAGEPDGKRLPHSVALT